MTIKEKEEFIARSFHNYPILSGDSYYNVCFLIIPHDNYKRFELFKDVDCSTDARVFSHDTDYSIYTGIDDSSFQHLFNVDYIFKDESGSTDQSYYNCLDYGSENTQHNFTWVFSADDEECQNGCDSVYGGEYQLYHNGSSCSGYYISSIMNANGSFSSGSFETPSYSSGSSRDLNYLKSKLIEYYSNDGYPSNNNIYSKYNPILRNYVDCLQRKINQCCLEWC